MGTRRPFLVSTRGRAREHDRRSQPRADAATIIRHRPRHRRANRSAARQCASQHHRHHSRRPDQRRRPVHDSRRDSPAPFELRALRVGFAEHAPLGDRRGGQTRDARTSQMQPVPRLAESRRHDGDRRAAPRRGRQRHRAGGGGEGRRDGSRHQRRRPAHVARARRHGRSQARRPAPARASASAARARSRSRTIRSTSSTASASKARPGRRR